MRMIDSRWTELAAGYQMLQHLQAKLEGEFGRALQAGHKQKFRKELTSWQKKRRVFFILAALSPLSIVALCVTAFYLREVACVIIYWVLLVLIILVTLAVAGRDYIRDVLNRPEPAHTQSVESDLEQRWWASLSPQATVLQKNRIKEGEDFTTVLARNLTDRFLAARGLVLTDSGVWLFVTRNWSGTIIRQEETWKLGTKRRKQNIPGQPPDDEWLNKRKTILDILETKLPQFPWVASLLQGGVVFTHPQALLERSLIKGNTAAYGPARAWIEQLHRAPSNEQFTLPVQLELLDALPGAGDGNASSARQEAERLYQQAAVELRDSIEKLVR